MMAIAFLLALSFGAQAQTLKSTAIQPKQTKVAKVPQNAEITALRKNLKIPVELKDHFIPPVDAITTAQQDAAAKAAFQPLPSTERVMRNNIPVGVSYLGKGYNVHIAEYAEAKDLTTSYILDIDALIDDGHIGITKIPESYYRYESGESVSKFAESTANSIGVSGSYGFFKGSVNVAWNSSQQGEYGRSFASIAYKEMLYKLYINPAVDLHYYLTEAYKKDLKIAMESGNYQNLINKYGTHVLLTAIMGGKIDYYVSTDYRFEESRSDYQVNVEASFNAGFASAGVKVGSGSTSANSEFSSSKSEKKVTKPNFANGWSYVQWYNTLTNNAALIDFQDESTTGSTGLKLLYEISKGATIFDDSGKATFIFTSNANYQTAYKNYANGQKYAEPKGFPEIDNCITGLALYKTTAGKWEKDGSPLESGGKPWKKIFYIGGALHSYYDSDVRYVLYTRTERTGENNPPIVEIYLTDAGIKKENAYEIFKKKYGNDPTAKLYTVPLFGQNPKELTSSASSPAYPGTVYGVNFNDVGNGRGARIFLNYVTSTRLGPNTKPIKRVRFNKRDNNPPYFVPNSLIGTFFTVMNSKGQEQDSAEGYQNYKDKSRKHPDVYGQNYLQYSYE